MKLDNIYEGQIIKNYKEFCSLVEEESKTGNAKISQVNEWQRHVKFTNVGHQFIIEEIYESPKIKNDLRRLGNSRKSFDCFSVSIEYENSIGVYKITLDNLIYIGSTVVSYRQRFWQHYNRQNENPKTYQMLHSGGIFEIIEVCNCLDEQAIRNKENEYIKHYRKNTDCILVNSNLVFKPKNKYKTIRILDKQYNEVVELLQSNNIRFK